jgi:peptide deformylase
MAAGRQPGQPRGEQSVQLGLSDPDGRVRPDPGETQILVDVFGLHGADVVETEPGCVLGAQGEGALVHIDRPHRGRRRPCGQGDGDGAVPAAEVEQVPPGGRVWCIEQQIAGPGIDLVGREDGAVGDEGQVEVGEGEIDPSSGRRRGRLGVEVLHGSDASLACMAPYTIRLIGDPVLKQRASEIVDIDGRVARLVDDMFATLHETDNGLGLAAPQVGVQKRLFVYEMDDEQHVLINPEIRESRDEWSYHEGCLSIPGLYFEIVRPKEVYLVGYDLDGNEVQLEVDELEARLFQHELDHLDGVLMIEHLDDEQRKEAKRALRELSLRSAQPEAVDNGGLRLP